MALAPGRREVAVGVVMAIDGVCLTHVLRGQVSRLLGEAQVRYLVGMVVMVLAGMGVLWSQPCLPMLGKALSSFPRAADQR